MILPVGLSWCNIRPMECDRCGSTWPDFFEDHLSVSLPESHHSDVADWREMVYEALCDPCALDLLGYLRWRGGEEDVAKFVEVLEARTV